MSRQARSPQLLVREGSVLAPWRPPAGDVKKASDWCRLLSDTAVELLRLLENEGCEQASRVMQLGVELTAACIWTEAYVATRSHLWDVEMDWFVAALDGIWAWWEVAAMSTHKWSAGPKCPQDGRALMCAWRFAGRGLGELLSQQMWLWSVDLLAERDWWVLKSLEQALEAVS
jgi:hypothetical protein